MKLLASWLIAYATGVVTGVVNMTIVFELGRDTSLTFLATAALFGSGVLLTYIVWKRQG